MIEKRAGYMAYLQIQSGKHTKDENISLITFSLLCALSHLKLCNYINLVGHFKSADSITTSLLL